MDYLSSLSTLWKVLFFGFGNQKTKNRGVASKGYFWKGVAWLAGPLETAELIVLKAIIANDTPTDDRCTICHERHGIPHEDGTITEHAFRFPCGHDVGNVCFRIWPEEEWLRSGCFFCHKSVVPARYVQEQVKEIWAIVKEMSSEDIYNEQITRGPLSRAIEPLQRYVGFGEAASLKHLEEYREAPRPEWLMEYHEDLAPSFEWLLIATWDFLFAVRKYIGNTKWMNSQGMSLEAIERRKCEVELSYNTFQTVVRDAAMLDTVITRHYHGAPCPNAP